MTLYEQLTDLYFNGTLYYATGQERDGGVSYSPTEGKPSEEQLAEHLAGDLVLGSYTLLADSTVRWICLDVDSTDLQKAKNITEEISDLLGNTPHAIEFSGNKGYHVWIFLQEPVEASRAKAWGLRLREAVGAPASGDPHVEVFPKQDLLTPSSPMGNLVKVPLGVHPKTRKQSMFVDRTNGWENGPPVPASVLLDGRVDFAVLDKVLQEASPLQRMIALLKPYWVDGERHNLALALSGYLASLGWIRDDVQELITELVESVGGDEQNLTQCVDTTYARLASGKSLQGFSGLSERLSVNVMRTLSELAGQNIADPGLQIVDRIRLDKGAVFIKVREVIQTALANLQDNGRFIKTSGNEEMANLFWLDRKTHRLINCRGIAWQMTLNQRFGINLKEAFGSQVDNGLLLRSQYGAEVSKVYKRFHWDGMKLWINFGGPEVYCLTGKREERTVSYNGDNEFLFMSDGNGLTGELSGVNLLTVTPTDPWKYLTDDLSFSTSANIAADNEQQRQLLRAWILQIFFGQIMKTRPIALMLGPRGSGKTTAARRILRFFEGFDEDVLGITDDKQDALRASIERHLVVVLDNLERTKARWLDSMLNRLATGAQIELRKLHTTNEMYRIIPDCFVIGTGIELPSSEESLFSRLLPFEMNVLTAPKPEFFMQSKLKDNFASAWAGMLDYLDSVVTELTVHRTAESPTQSRLADFQVFCARIKGCKAVNGKVLMDGLGQLVQSQQNVMLSNSPAVAALDLWLAECNTRLSSGGDNDATVWRTSGDLFKLLQRVAHIHKLEGFNWTTPQGFGRHFFLLADALGPSHRIEVQTVHNGSKGRDDTQYRFVSYQV